MMNIETAEVVTAEYFATISKGKIVTLCDATPPHELRENQIMLTKPEYEILRAIDGKLDEAIKAIAAIKAKVLANGS